MFFSFGTFQEVFDCEIFYIYSAFQKNPFFCIFPYKLAIFFMEETHLNRVEKLWLCYHFMIYI